MKNIVCYIGILIIAFSMVNNKTNAQIINGAYKRNDIYEKKPMPLPTAREADIFWSKIVWRVIDLREKANITLYYPTAESNGRNNLINTLLKGIENGQITPYDAQADDDFKIPMSYEQVKERFGAKLEYVDKRDFDTGETEKVAVAGEVRPGEIKQFMLKEEWYFDKQASSLNVRIIGICPIREYFREGDDSGLAQYQKVFWVYYPEARKILATNLVLNPYNEARQNSFDDYFIKRMFSGYIVRESNIYNDRSVSSYLTGKDAMLESKKIEEEIFNYEQDLWEY